MKRALPAAAGLIVVALLSACGPAPVKGTAAKASTTSSPSSSSSTATATPTFTDPPKPEDGTQNYPNVDAIYQDVVARGITCTSYSPLANNKSECTLPGGGHLVFQLWMTAQNRDDSTTQLIVDSNDNYCYAIGRGDNANWSVDATDDYAACTAVVGQLGGRWYDNKGDGESAALATTTAAPTTPATQTLVLAVTSSGNTRGSVTLLTMFNGSWNESQDTAAHLPWTKTFQLEETQSAGDVSFNAQASSGSNRSITCTETLDGRVIKTNTSTGPYAVVQC